MERRNMQQSWSNRAQHGIVLSLMAFVVVGGTSFGVALACFNVGNLFVLRALMSAGDTEHSWVSPPKVTPAQYALLEAAQGWFKQASFFRAEAPRLRTTAGKIAFWQGELSRAEELLIQLGAIDAKQPLVCLLRGEVSGARGEAGQRIAAWGRIPQFSKYLMMRGNWASSHGRQDEAMAYFKAAVDLAPSDCTALLSFGRALALTRRNAEALACYNKVLRSLIATPLLRGRAYAYRGEVQYQAGDSQAAVESCELAVQSAPADYFTHYIAANVIGTRDQQRGAELWMQAMALNPSQSEPYVQLVNIYSNREDWGQAVAWCGKTEEAFGARHEAWRKLSETLKASGCLAALESCLEAAIKNDRAAMPLRLAYYHLLAAGGRDPKSGAAHVEGPSIANGKSKLGEPH